MDGRTTIKATCPTCGEVSIGPDDIDLRANRTFPSYSFVCPLCLTIVRKRASKRAVEMLVAGGVDPDGWRPQERHPESAVGGPRITYDDVLSFALAAAAVNDLAAYAAEVEA